MPPGSSPISNRHNAGHGICGEHGFSRLHTIARKLGLLYLEDTNANTCKKEEKKTWMAIHAKKEKVISNKCKCQNRPDTQCTQED